MNQINAQETERKGLIVFTGHCIQQLILVLKPDCSNSSGFLLFVSQETGYIITPLGGGKRMSLSVSQ